MESNSRELEEGFLEEGFPLGCLCRENHCPFS